MRVFLRSPALLHRFGDRFERRPLFWLLAALSLALAANGSGRAADLPAVQRDMLLASVAAGDALWDESAGLLWSNASNAGRGSHGVRPSAWYALGLMMRDAPGDRARSLRLIRGVVDQQIAAPGAPWDGTFRRTAEDPPLQSGAQMWTDYDPNWRQFIGSTFALLLLHYPDRLPEGLRAQLRDAIDRAIAGELAQRRLEPGYTNIALMHGFLWAFAATQSASRAAWLHEAEAWTESVYARFAPHGTFDEFNSPTYYGVDLYGLALLRRHGATPRLRELGGKMEAALWRDIAQFYHAGLRNLCGPFDRAYGMDMQRYAALVGIWIGLEVPAAARPFPPLGGPMAHAVDFLCTPSYVLLGAAIPADARPHFESFQRERQLTRPIADGRRVATAWLGRDVMLGGEATGGTRGVASATSQFHPATIHWRTPAGAIGWIALRECAAVDARAAENQLTIQTRGDATFRIFAPGARADDLTPQRWNLPGLAVAVTTDAASSTSREASGALEITYRGASSFVLRTQTPR